ncbi:MAG TPA: hypothetical protein VHF25_04805, partial [Nitriliruptorales bacterium]|nr:hypothetical protein [Nitriliruptorales bacterium]
IEVPSDMFPGRWCLKDKTVRGRVWIIEVNPVTGEQRRIREEERCLPWPGARDDDEVVPPALSAVRDAVARRLPTPTVALNPDHQGVTGMDTWLWYADDAATPLAGVDHDRDPATAPAQGLQVTATAGPYTITATAWIARYRWTFHQPDHAIGVHRTATRPGSQQHPAATWMPNTKGVYQVTAATDWHGHYSWTGPDGASGAGDLGTVTRSATRRWPVVEIRSVLIR